MVVKTKSLLFAKVREVSAASSIGGGGAPGSRRSAGAPHSPHCPQGPQTRPPRRTLRPQSTNPFFVVSRDAAGDAEDVIDLGAPRRLPARLAAADGSAARPRRPYTPNPRLYPGSSPRVRPKRKDKRAGEEGGRRRRRLFRRPVPNSRLYRPAPPARPSPAAPPAARPAPPTRPSPAASPLALDTASRAALRLAERRPSSPTQAHTRGDSTPASRLVVRLPPSRAAPAAPAMDTANRHSTSPECSDGNDAASAPSEFLAEFLSAIMRRQYAEALKYCRLILQYEPHNTTARGFYPLLQHKLQKHKASKDDASSSEETSLRRGRSHNAEPCEEVMEQEADESESDSCRSGGSPSRSRSRSEEASCASQSSLELDSSEAAARSSASASVSLSRRTDVTDRTDRTDRTDHTDSTCGSGGSSGASGASGAHWESSASRSRSRSEREADDNGNEPARPPRLLAACASNIALDDLENDNAADGEPPAPPSVHLKSESASAALRRLRAHFAASIK